MNDMSDTPNWRVTAIIFNKGNTYAEQNIQNFT